MDRIQYINIRKSLNLDYKPSAALIFCLQNVALIGATIGVWVGFRGLSSQYLAIPLISAFIFRNFSMMHEAVHKAASKNQTINDLIGLTSGAVCLLAYEPWKRSHLEHHIWSGNIDKDPVTAIITAYPKMSPIMRKTLSFFWMIWFPMLACMQYVVFWWLAAKQFAKKPTSSRLLVSLAAPVLFWGLLFALCPVSFSVYALLPALFFYMVAVEVVNFPHHLQLPQNRGETKLMVWEQYQVARSCVYPKWFGRLVVLNFNYHIEHHMFPDVPWYHLEELHVKVKAALAQNYNTDPHFQWIIENKPKPIGEVLKARGELPAKPNRDRDLVA